jgi:hypothetical protein
VGSDRAESSTALPTRRSLREAERLALATQSAAAPAARPAPTPSTTAVPSAAPRSVAVPPAQVDRPLQAGPGLPPVAERPRTAAPRPIGPPARDLVDSRSVPSTSAGTAPVTPQRPAPATPAWLSAGPATVAASSAGRSSGTARPLTVDRAPTVARPADAPLPATVARPATTEATPSAAPTVAVEVVPEHVEPETGEVPSPAGPAAASSAPHVASPAETSHVASQRHRPSRGADAPVRRAGRPSRLVVRLGVLGALAGGTVVIPALSQGAFAGAGSASYDALADSTLPSTVSALAGTGLSAPPPTSLIATEDALVDRGAVAASRDEDRSILAGCDGSTRPSGQNGLLKTADLCTVWDGHTQLRADAAVSLAEFNQAFAARFGVDLCLSSGYRTLAQQRAVKAEKGGLAAAPGKSNHGWGLAVDLCQDQTSGTKWTWLNENGPTYGWQNPAWAQPGGSGPHEKWHWEYVKGVKADGEYYDG